MCSQCDASHPSADCPYAWLTAEAETEWRLQAEYEAGAARYAEEYPDYE